MNRSERIALTVKHPERRAEPRSTKLPTHRVEIKFPSVPVYQLKVRDVSPNGAGIIVRADSKFLTLVQIGQELNVNFLAPADHATLSGYYRLRIEHIYPSLKPAGSKATTWSGYPFSNSSSGNDPGFAFSNAIRFRLR